MGAQLLGRQCRGAGPALAVREMIDACKQGPPAANVYSVEAEMVDVPEQRGFEQRPTA